MTRNFVGHRQFQSLSHPNFVELYEIDLQPIDAGISPTDRYIRFTNWTPEAGSAVRFNSLDWFQIPLEAEGFSMTTQGVPPSPKITVSNIGLAFTGVINEWNDLVGAKLTRKRVLAEALDTGPSPDLNAKWPDETWWIEIKEAETKLAVTFGLATPFELDAVVLPRRRALRHTCPFRYRGAECGFTEPPFWGADNKRIPPPDLVSPLSDTFARATDDKFNSSVALNNRRQELAVALEKYENSKTTKVVRAEVRFEKSPMNYVADLKYGSSNVLAGNVAFWGNSDFTDRITTTGEYRRGNLRDTDTDRNTGLTTYYYEIERWETRTSDVAADLADVNAKKAALAAAENDYNVKTQNLENARNAWLVVSPFEPKDLCGKNVQACTLRHPNQPLPFGGFPGLLLANPQ